MPYKHEETHKKVIEGYHAYLGDDTGQKEIEEVYAKAEAFNEIVNLLKASHSDYAEDILEDIDVIVMDYRED
ncbi:DUF1024 family protein [Mammaliicoccus sciuri]|uniref:DUF1024 family protein n=1 Tax=Mammaliicoccus sciuri TaxID=1296 RepID=UPI000D1ED5EC|nr:DUF1024 family protein [Mammaliicoccus sciuri]PTJ69568.1 hypothetical protein BU008_12385 [Mammaliicoccus sciuri]